MGIVKPTKSFKLNSLKYGAVWPPNTKKLHVGVDVDRDKPGTPVFAIKTGTVRHVNTLKEWDSVVCIEHKSDNGKNLYTSVYWHIEGLKVKVGQKVKTGQQIGVIGRNNGYVAYHDHLHFGIRYAPFDKVKSLWGAIDKKDFPEKFRDPVKFIMDNL